MESLQQSKIYQKEQRRQFKELKELVRRHQKKTSELLREFNNKHKKMTRQSSKSRYARFIMWYYFNCCISSSHLDNSCHYGAFSLPINLQIIFRIIHLELFLKCQNIVNYHLNSLSPNCVCNTQLVFIYRQKWQRNAANPCVWKAGTSYLKNDGNH